MTFLQNHPVLSSSESPFSDSRSSVFWQEFFTRFVAEYRDFNNKLHKVNVVFRHIQSFKMLETLWFGITWVAFLIFALFFWKFSLIEELRRTIFSIFLKWPSLKFSKMVPFDRESWKSYQYELSAVSEVFDSSYPVLSIR